MRTLVLPLVAGMLAASVGWADEKKAGKFDPASLVGTWEFVSGEKPEEKLEKDRLKDQKVEITRESLTLTGPAGKFVMKYTLDAKVDPVGISLEITDSPFGGGMKTVGIIKVDGDTFTLCYAEPEQPAPKKFEVNATSKTRLYVLKRVK